MIDTKTLLAMVVAAIAGYLAVSWIIDYRKREQPKDHPGENVDPGAESQGLRHLLLRQGNGSTYWA
jgi:hypothetical protein